VVPTSQGPRGRRYPGPRARRQGPSGDHATSRRDRPAAAPTTWFDPEAPARAVLGPHPAAPYRRHHSSPVWHRLRPAPRAAWTSSCTALECSLARTIATSRSQGQL